MHSASTHKVVMTAASDNAEDEFRRMAEEEGEEAVRLEWRKHTFYFNNFIKIVLHFQMPKFSLLVIFLIY